MATNLARKWWPEYFQPPRQYKNTDEIISDILDRLSKKTDVKKRFLETKNLDVIFSSAGALSNFVDHYGLNDVENPHFYGADHKEVFRFIIISVWKHVHKERQ